MQYKWESEFASARRLRESARQCRHVVPAPSVDGREAPHSGSVGRRLWAHFGQGGGRNRCEWRIALGIVAIRCPRPLFFVFVLCLCWVSVKRGAMPKFRFPG